MRRTSPRFRPSVKEGLEIIPVSHVDEVLAQALAKPMVPIEWTDADEHAAEPLVPPHGWRRGGPPVRH